MRARRAISASRNTYPGRGIISRQNEKLFEAWDKEDLFDDWERERARL